MPDKKFRIDIEVDSRTGEARVKELGGSLERLGRRGKKAFDQASRGLEGFRTRLLPANNLAAKLAGAFGLYQLAGVAKGFLDVASSMETYETTLSTVLKSQEKARGYMEWIQEFAASTPFEIPGLVESATRLEAYGLDAKKYMRTLGDTAASMGKPIMAAVEMIADASQGEFERMKEFGLRASDVAKAAGFSSVKEMTSTRENLVKGTETLMSMLEERYAGGMEKLSRTWGGMVSNAKDLWTRFRQAVMDAGVFDYLREGLRMVLESFQRMRKEGNLGQWAGEMASKVITGFGIILKGAGAVADGFRGWQMIWAGLKGAFALFAMAVNKGLSKLLLGAYRVADFFDLDIKEKIRNAMHAAAGSIRDWEEQIAAADEAVVRLSARESAFSRMSRLHEELKERAEAVAETVDEKVVPALERQEAAARKSLEAHDALYQRIGGLYDEHFEGVERREKEMARIREASHREEIRRLAEAVDEEGKWIEAGIEGSEKMRRAYRDWGIEVERVGKRAFGGLERGASDLLYSFTDRTRSMGERWQDFTRSFKDSFFRAAADMTAERIILFFKTAWAGSPGGQGTIEKLLGIDVPFLQFAYAGEVPGAWNGRAGFGGDTVPIMATPGEYMIRREVARSPGMKDFLEWLNYDPGGAGFIAAMKNVPALTGMPGLGRGGPVEAPWVGHYGFLSKLFKPIAKILSPVTKLISKITDSTVGKIISGIANVAIAVATGGASIPYQVIGAAGGGIGAGLGGGDVLGSALFGGALGGAGYMMTPSGPVYQGPFAAPPQVQAALGANAPMYLAGGFAGPFAAPPHVQSALGQDAPMVLAGRESVSRILASMPRSTYNLIKSKVTDAGSWLRSLPDNLVRTVKDFDVARYVGGRMKDVLTHFTLLLAGASGGGLLDEPAMRDALGIGEVRSFASGTGVGGLPRTGLFYGHRGEIVKSPTESERERRGEPAGRPLRIIVQVGAEAFEAYIARVSDDVRVRAERRGMGARRIYPHAPS